MTSSVETEPDRAIRLAAATTRRVGFAAGVAAAAVMLLVIVALRIVSGVVSLPEIVAEGLLVAMPGALFSAVLDSLQHAAKPLFYVAIAIGVLVVGGLLGSWYGAQPGWRRAGRLVVAVWLALGLIVYTLLGAGPFGQHLNAGFLWHALSLLLIVGVFGVVLVSLHAVLLQRAHQTLPSTPNITRRALLRNTAAAVVGTVALGGLWRVLADGGLSLPGAGSSPTAAGSVSIAAEPNAPPFDLQGMSSEVTPTERFYTVSKNLLDPVVAGNSWRLKVDGLVDRPFELTYEQLTAMPSTKGYYTLMCISNEVGGDLWGNALWRGIKLHTLLEQAGVRSGVVKAMFSGADDYKDSVAIERALHPDTFLAWEMNGAPLAREHGFPARLLIPGIYGMKNVKWLTGITLIDNAEFRGFWQSQGWDDGAPYQTASRIDVPRGRETLSTGPVPIGGVAFAGDRGISRVEVSADGGRTWLPAQVKPGLSPYTWQLWRADVAVDNNVKTLRVRATDGQGTPQQREVNPPFPAGSTGYHSITVAVS